MTYKKEHLIPVLCVLLFAKIIIAGLSIADSLGALVLLSSLHLDRVLLYLFPNRVDVYQELSLVQSKLVEITSKSEELERDVTALKIGSVKR